MDKIRAAPIHTLIQAIKTAANILMRVTFHRCMGNGNDTADRDLMLIFQFCGTIDGFSIGVPKFNMLFSFGFFKCRARTKGNMYKIDTYFAIAGREADNFYTPHCAKVCSEPRRAGRAPFERWKSSLILE